jgi:hypothetical protein
MRYSNLNQTVIALNLTREFNMITFENALELVSQLPREQQEMLIEIVKKRCVEVRRQEFLRECQEGLAEYRTGNLQPMTVEDAIADLDRYLEDSEDDLSDR